VEGDSTFSPHLFLGSFVLHLLKAIREEEEERQWREFNIDDV